MTDSMNCFDIVVSGEVKMVKPDSDIYKYSLERFNITNPGSTIFIDDRKENVEAANDLGLKGIHYLNSNRLKKQLKDFGVEI